MKKRIFFDLLALLAIAVGFFVLLYFQDLDIDFLDHLKNSDTEMLVDKTEVENQEYAMEQADKVDEQTTLEKQTFMQPAEEELANCYCYSVLNEEEKVVYLEIYGILKEMREDVELSTLDVELIEKVFGKR